MHLIVLQFVGPLAMDVPDGAALSYAINACRVPSDRVEHVRVRAGPGRLDVALFLIAEDEEEAHLAARALCTRVLKRYLPDFLRPASG